MPAMIRVEKLGEGKYQATVSDGRGETRHTVGLAREDFEKLAGGKTTPEELIRRSFEFLLEREPKEAILRSFDLPVIGRYFPEYEREIRRRLGV
jgi:hypothetical protein